MSRIAWWVSVLAFAVPAVAQESPDFFRQNCVSCHTIGGGRLTGPDLKDVTSRKDREWLIRFVVNPQSIIATGDAYALKLQEEARGVVMPAVSGMTADRATALLNLIDAESKLEKSQFAGLQISDRPFTAADIALGAALFGGTRRLSAAGPSCMSCHTVNGFGMLGGGRLGPDLTRVYERLQGRKNLAAWLVALATPTMLPIFKKHPLTAEEILPLVAYLEDRAKNAGGDDPTNAQNFVLFGLAGAIAGLLLFDAAWKTRFTDVRRSLVRQRNAR